MSRQYTMSEVLALIDSGDFGFSDEEEIDFEGEGYTATFQKLYPKKMSEMMVNWLKKVDMDAGSIMDEPLDCLDSPVDPVSQNKAVENLEALAVSHAMKLDEGSIEPELRPSPCILICEQSSDSSY